MLCNKSLHSKLEQHVRGEKTEMVEIGMQQQTEDYFSIHS